MSTSDAPDESARVAALRAGIALYAAEEYHAAHDPWEDVWLDLKDAVARGDAGGADANGAVAGDTDDTVETDGVAGDAPTSVVRDEALFHGLIQLTAAQHHARDRNWSGAVGLADGARGYLADLPDRYRGVDAAALRDALAGLAADPERVERGPAPPLTHGGERVAPTSLSLSAATLAAEALAEEHGLDAGVVADAGRFAREEEAMGRSRFAALLFDLLRADDPQTRGLVYDRLSGLVERERRKETDVEGLF
ncbi:DUF309 domain-containing protein [Halobaculum sp. CBA1158]|uniref:DUF309 domain-containing protein n=1 Tax=Halobaculum sp. CBA1158 TaxID=2904243 RepID=UPI001F2CE146|nr:DUF309 domain-containing protein [Halobaculum sp. CBA1158]UIP00708.1 DUF309 domain-containing protein [Halobaculum sp. CBA1158]